MFKKILIANRGEIACRVIKTARRMGVATVAIHSDADRDALHVRMADEAIHVGAAPAAESYIHLERVLAAIRDSGAEAAHPGYGFLSERAEFARALEAAGVAFIGPPASAIEAMGDKIASKRLAAEAGVSTVPGHLGVVADAAEATAIAREIGYPVMIKASAGGGGKGMRVAHDDAAMRDGFEGARNEAKASFGDDRIFIEKFVVNPRHIEIQVLADGHGNAIHLGERECSIQRRNQKVIEEAPSPFLDAGTRAAMGAQAVALAQAVGYRSAGTVEFIVDAARNFYFLEMNTRLQVEHPVTELVTGLDLVELMIRVAAGEALSLAQEAVRLEGWAIESRIYAEDPYRGFLPSIGRLTRYRPPAERAEPALVVRNDTGVQEGGEISRFYDPMIAKLCAWAPGRAAAIEAMRGALDGFELEGIGHNIPFLSAVMDHPRFVAGELSTGFIAEEFPDGFSGVRPEAAALERLAAAAVALTLIRERRDGAISDALEGHRRPLGRDRVIAIGEAAFAARAENGTLKLTRLEAPALGPETDLDAGRLVVVDTGWRPGERLARVTVDGTPLTLRVDPLTEGVRLRWRGADLRVLVRSPMRAALAALMPPKREADTSKLLLCPMPGLVVRLHVAEGDEVQEGQALVTVEAMKMENLLRAERPARVARLAVAPGDPLAVDDVIMEFE